MNDRITVPKHLLSPRGGDHYVLRVAGNDMEEENISDGDYVIVLRRDTVAPGEMAVIVLGDDASIKRVYPEGEMLRLESARKSVACIRVPAVDVQIQGIVVGLMRKF